MKIGMLENGMDSLHRGFVSFLQFEKAWVSKKISLDDYFHLKQAVLSTHHGIEIIMKYILIKNSEFLVVSKIDDLYMQAYKEKEKNNKASVFETLRGEEIHTITYEEALKRIQYFSNIKLTKDIETRLKKLNTLRNSLTHAEINVSDYDVIDLFRNLLYEIDIVFFKAIGEDYQTMSGYDLLVQNYEAYMKILDEAEMGLKKETIEVFKRGLENAGIAFGEETILYVNDVVKAKIIISTINSSNLEFGMDMFNWYCSGDVKIEIWDDAHFALFAKDNNAKYVFKFKSMLLIFPKVTDSRSPIIVFESEEDKGYDEIYGDEIYYNEYSGRCFEGIVFENASDKRITYDPKEINEFETKCYWDETYDIPVHYNIQHFLSSNIFSMVNVQGLGWFEFSDLLKSAKGMDGYELKIAMENEYC